ncbi:hypothetical protein [Olleya sp. Bg11-27]|uniref:hypothetical protein n=1 Tax=Olleya sp. Bg11-27 TaxID=2058135 RepID=UPI000C305235|nr:hypothetical protein [Olleya sp. Bg11-27]AUC74591.1 hypothetical protein CW732_02405 [Olleya sp. Bg11-27]
MRRIIYVFSILLVVSCSNRREKASPESMRADEVVTSEALLSKKDVVDLNTFEYQELSSQKLQELYDLISLKETHPEFSETISSQLKDYTNDSISSSLTLSGDVVIKNIQLQGDIIKVSDSIKKMKLYYDVVSNNTIQKDSVLATISSSTIAFEDKMIQSKKIKFSHL